MNRYRRDSLRELRIRAGRRTEVARKAGPVLGILEDVEEVALRHPGADFLFEFGESFGPLGCRELLQVRRPIRVDAQLVVGRKAGIDLRRRCDQLALQRRGEILAALGYVERGAVGGQPRLAFRPRQPLGAVVDEILGADHIEIAGLQGVGQMDEHTDFERASIQGGGFRPGFDDKAPPALDGETEIDRVQHLVTAGVAKPAHERQRIEQAVVLCRRSDVEQIDQLEQQASVLGMNRPKQRQVILVMPGGHCFALLRQGFDATLFREQIPDLAPECSVGFLCLRGFEHPAEDADQRFLDFPVLIVQSLQLLLGRSLRPANRAQHHLDQFVAATHVRLTQQAEQQRVSLSRPGDVEEIIHLQRRGFRGELAKLGVRDAFEERVRIDQAGQPFQPLDPEPDRLRGRRPGRLLEAIEVGRDAVRRLGQQLVQHRLVVGRQALPHLVVDPRMDLGAHAVDQPIKRAERRQVDRRRLQCFDRAIDEIGGIAHRFGGFQRGVGHQALARFVVWPDGKVRANRRLIAIQRFRPARRVGPGGRSRQSQLRGQMCGRVGMRFLGRRKASEVLARLQQDRERQAARIAARVRANESAIRIGQAVAGSQFLAGQPRAWARIGRAVDRRHGVSGKGSAEPVGRST